MPITEDTGHFALETHEPQIAQAILAFLDRVSVRWSRAKGDGAFGKPARLRAGSIEVGAIGTLREP